MKLTISLDDKEVKILKKRGKKNILTLKEQVEDIVRRSCVSYSKTSDSTKTKIDDRLVEAFSRDRRGRKKKKK